MKARDDSGSGARLPPKNATSDDLHQAWDGTNEQWWDWYMSLAENDPRAADLTTPETPALPSAAPSAEELRHSLEVPYMLSEQQREEFRSKGFIKLKAVLHPSVLAALRHELLGLFDRLVGTEGDLRFRSLEMLWLQSDLMRRFALSPRLGRLAAELLGVASVRLYHDNGLSKEPGCGRTPWHYDAHHFPIASRNVCTVWVPLQATPRAMGPLAFAEGMDCYEHVRDLPFTKFDSSYDRCVGEAFAAQHVQVEDGPFALGEVSFHHVQSFHTAGPNLTTAARCVLATTYFEAGARVVPAPTMIAGDWQKFMPGIGPGELITSPFNPVCYPI